MKPHCFAAALLAAAVACAADLAVITPAGARPPMGPFSRAIAAGDFLYVSGQGAAKADGSFPTTAAAQMEQCLANVREIVEAAGLTMQHVVYAQVYLKDMSAYAEADRVWAKYFAKDPPARAVLGVAGLPADTPVEIAVTAFRDLSRRKVIGAGKGVSDGVVAGDRFYFSGAPGRDRRSGAIPDDPAQQVQIALDQVRSVLRSAGMDFEHVVFVNPYLTAAMPMDVMNRIYAKHFEFGNTPARATIRVASLPGGTHIVFTGVAVADLSRRAAVRPKNMAPSDTASPCVFAGDTFFCSAKAGFLPGPNGGIYASTVETQVRQTMRNLLDGLEEAGLTFANVVATNVYLDDIADFARMNRVYAEYFPGMKPARTTVQQSAPVAERKPDARDRWPALEQISLIAVK